MPRDRITLNRPQAEAARLALMALVDQALADDYGGELTLADLRGLRAAVARIDVQLAAP